MILTFLLCGPVIFLLTGCTAPARLIGLMGTPGAPRIRLSSYASATLGTPFIDPNDLGMHSYEGVGTEKNGILYTCRAGHIDIAHLRKAADWTAYLTQKMYRQLQQGDTRFSFKLWEPSRYFVRLEYPQNWEQLPELERDQIARDISIKLGQYFAFTGLTWHEILTWFGYSSVPWYPEFPSAFSWEDTYSNLLGTHLAVQALLSTRHSYDEAMTLALNRELQDLEAQSKQTAARAAQAVKGNWYSGDLLFLVNIKKRNLDIGLDDGYVTPWIVPDLEGCERAEPKLCPAPNLNLLRLHGFSMKLELEPRELQKSSILRIAYPDPDERRKRIEPAMHFPIIMEYIRQDAIHRFGPEVDAP
jgi:hypothetical protein